MNIEIIEKKLLTEIEAVDAFLNKDNIQWAEIRKVLNILKSKNRKLYPKIKRQLFMDFRMVHDHQISDPLLDKHMNKAWELSEILEEKA